MKKVMVRYKVKADKVAENEQLVKEVYKQLHEKNLTGFRYQTLKLEDGVTFIHIAFPETDEANKTFAGLPAFKNFQANIKERCDELPLVTEVMVIGSHNMG